MAPDARHLTILSQPDPPCERHRALRGEPGPMRRLVAATVLALGLALAPAAMAESDPAAVPAVSGGILFDSLVTFVDHDDLPGFTKVYQVIGDPNLSDPDGVPLLAYAASHGAQRIVGFLLAEHADPNRRDGQLATPLHHAAFAHQDELLETLIQAGADPDAMDINENTPVMTAAAAGQLSTLQALIRLGATADRVNRAGMNLVACAAVSDSPAVAEALSTMGVDVNEPDYDGVTPLAYAVVSGEGKTCEVLLRHGAKLEAASAEGITPLVWALLRGNDRLAAMLLGRGARVNSRGPGGITPLMAASSCGKATSVALLLKAHADLFAVDAAGRNALSYAADPNVVKLLRTAMIQAERRERGGLEVKGAPSPAVARYLAGRFGKGAWVATRTLSQGGVRMALWYFRGTGKSKYHVLLLQDSRRGWGEIDAGDPTLYFYYGRVLAGPSLASTARGPALRWTTARASLSLKRGRKLASSQDTCATTLTLDHGALRYDSLVSLAGAGRSSPRSLTGQVKVIPIPGTQTGGRQ